MAQGSIIVRELIAQLGFELDDDALDEWDAQVTDAAQSIASTVAAMGAAVAGTVATVTQSLISMGDELGDAAVRTGLSAQELAEWDHVAQLSGTSAEAVRGVLSRLPGVMDRVVGGNRAMRRTFAELGVSVTDAGGSMRASGDVMQDLVGALSRIRNPAQRAAMATRVFGRRGAELAGLFEQGADGVARLRSEVRELYGDDLDGFVAAAGRAQDAEDRLSMQMRALGVTIGAEVLPVVADMLEQAVALGRSFVLWAQDTTVIRAAMIALTAVMLGAAAAGAVLALSTIEIWGPVAAVMAAVAISAAAIGFAFDDIATFFEGGDSLIGRFLQGLFGMEGAARILSGVQELVKGIRVDLEALVQVGGPDLRELVVGALVQWVAQMAAVAAGILVVTRGVVWLARTVAEGLAGAWTAAQSSFDRFVSRVMAGVAEARGAIEGVAGFLGVDVSGSGQPQAGAVVAQRDRLVDAARAVTTSSSRAVSVGSIVVQGVADAGEAAEAIQARIRSMLEGEADAAREDLVPEAA